MNNLELFLRDFNKVKELGYCPSRRTNSTGIGKTYEDLLGVVENNLKEPDLHGFEIKSQRAYTGSYVTLFTKSPSMPKAANTFLRETFGSQDEKYPELKVLHTSIFANRFNTHKSGHRFSLKIDNAAEKLFLLVANQSGEIISDDTYWTFDALTACLTGKLSNLAFVTAKTRKSDDGLEEFFFNKAIIYSNIKSLENFLNLIDQGLIMFDIRIGAYKTGKHRGKTHDHGSGFRVKKADMSKLYEIYDVVE